MKALIIGLLMIASVDVVHGINLDEHGNGRIIDPIHEDFDYISYKGLDAAPGDEMTTLFVSIGESDNIVLRLDWRR